MSEGPSKSIEKSEIADDFDAIATPEEFLEKIDVKTTNDIFDTIARKSGAQVEGLPPERRISKKKIEVRKSILGTEEKQARGHAYVHTGEIVLFWEEESNGFGIPTELITLKTLMHEAGHIRAGFESETTYAPEPTFGIEIPTHNITRTGVSERNMFFRSGSVVESEQMSGSLNEAITETIALDVLKEYLQRTGNSKYVVEKIFKRINAVSYFTERVMLHIVIDTFARKLNIDRETIWQSFVQAYMNKNSDLEEMFSIISSAFREEDPDIALLYFRLCRGNQEKDYSYKDIPKDLLDQNLKSFRDAIGRAYDSLNVEFVQDTLRLR